MKIIALALNNDSVYYVFLEPAWAGNHVVEALLQINKSDIKDFSIEISPSYEEAHKKAHLTQMLLEDYEALYK